MMSSVSGIDVGPLSRLCRALGDETRLRIVALLAHGELCVCHLEEALGLTQPNASRQLGILRAAGVVDSRRAGTWVHYRIADGQRDAVQILVGLLTGSPTRQRGLRSDLVRLRRSCGPNACR